jgi:hypothetical protein
MEMDLTAATGNDSAVFSVNDFPLELLANHIFAFVGSLQYRFVGGVGPTFERAYRMKYPEQTTHCNLSSMKHAKISFEEAPTKDKPLLQRIACDQTWYYYVRSEDTDLALLH